jgi:hypothetical protein
MDRERLKEMIAPGGKLPDDLSEFLDAAADIGALEISPAEWRSWRAAGLSDEDCIKKIIVKMLETEELERLYGEQKAAPEPQ